jgi:hypothetical protein
MERGRRPKNPRGGRNYTQIHIYVWNAGPLPDSARACRLTVDRFARRGFETT